MPRPPRRAPAGVIQHITARAPKGLPLFRADADRLRYLSLLGAEVTERGWSLRAYCLMGNHVHLLVRTPKPDLSFGIKWIHGTFARDSHRTYDGHGHVFGSRFHNRNVLTDDHYFACLRYIARNPVAAGLCATPDDWPWSAHRALAGTAPAPRYLDVTATHDLLTVAGYRSMVDIADADLLGRLARSFSADWMVRAVDEHHIPVPAIAAYLGLSHSATYRRLRDQRDRRASPLSRAGENEGPVP